MMALAPLTVQCMPDSFRRWPKMVLQPASTTPGATNKPRLRNLAQRILSQLVTRFHAMIEAGVWSEVRLAKVFALAQSSTRVQLWGILPARISLVVVDNVPLATLVSFFGFPVDNQMISGHNSAIGQAR
jgi:hypothetical protein